MISKNEVYKFEPLYLIPPGETLLETIEEMNLSQAELARRTGRPLKTINGIIKGDIAITPDTALQFERVLGIPAKFWINLETNYREAIARAKHMEDLEKDTDWLKNFPIKELTKKGWIERKDNDKEQLDELLKFFGVASIKAWGDIWQTRVAFRKSPTLESDQYALACWIRKAELEAVKQDCVEFDKSKFKQSLTQIRKLTKETDPDKFIPEMERICNECGVAVVFIPELNGTRVSGATKWLNSKNPMIALSVRHKTNDHLWFTFFHEAGHIILHGKKDTFIEGFEIKDQKEKEKEAEADRFASNLLIPPNEYEKFVQEKTYSADKIIMFADRIGIAPGIVVGRLQHDRYIPFSWHNKLKVYYKWEDED